MTSYSTSSTPEAELQDKNIEAAQKGGLIKKRVEDF